MRRLLPTVWAPLLAWVLLAPGPAVQPGAARQPEPALAQSESRQGDVPRSAPQAPSREVKLSAGVGRHGWPPFAFLPAAPPASRILVFELCSPLALGSTGIAPVPVAFPYFPTGPPRSS